MMARDRNSNFLVGDVVSRIRYEACGRDIGTGEADLYL